MIKEILKKQDKMNKIEISNVGDKVQEVLPELINRNTKLGNRLKSKLKVSSLLNNIEIRNQNYLKELVSSSDRTVQDIKSGLNLPKAMKLSSEKLDLLNSKILNDCFMKKNNVIFNTKKNLKKNTEEETNMIIKKSINTLRNYINPTHKNIPKPIIEVNKKKYLSESELSNAKKIIDNKIYDEEKKLKEKIKNYLDKVKIINLTNIKSKDSYDYKIQKLNKDKNRDFYLFAKHFLLNNSDIQMIHYKKLIPPPIRDRSCPNLENIKENLFPNIKKGELNNENYVNINNSNGVKIINGMKYYQKFRNKRKAFIQDENENKNNYTDIIINNKKDSFNTLKKIIIRNRSLITSSTKKFDTLSSLMDIKLPKISDYEIILNNENKRIEEEKKKNNKNNENNEDNEDNIFKNKQKDKYSNQNIFSNSELMKEFRALKNEIQSLKGKKLDIEENYIKHQEELKNLVFAFDKNKIKKKKDNLINDNGLINKKIFTENNPMMRMPSSHSVSIIKRKFKINSGINNKFTNKNYRNYSNHTRDRTSASSIKNSASSIFTTRKSGNKLNQIYNYIKKDQKQNILSNSLDIPLLFSLPQEKSYNNSKNNYNSSNITSLSDY